MSAPDLPAIFGNYTLGEFVEVVSPGGVSWLPQTAGWYWLGAALLILLARYAWRRLRRWHRNRYRREAARRLEHLLPDATSNLPGELNRLLKLAAIAGFGREPVAGLTGPAWVEFLNRQCETAPFDTELAQYLAEGPYRPMPMANTTRKQLVIASYRWLDEHRDPHGA